MSHVKQHLRHTVDASATGYFFFFSILYLARRTCGYLWFGSLYTYCLWFVNRKRLHELCVRLWKSAGTKILHKDFFLSLSLEKNWDKKTYILFHYLVGLVCCCVFLFLFFYFFLLFAFLSFFPSFSSVFVVRLLKVEILFLCQRAGGSIALYIYFSFGLFLSSYFSTSVSLYIFSKFLGLLLDAQLYVIIRGQIIIK